MTGDVTAAIESVERSLAIDERAEAAGRYYRPEMVRAVLAEFERLRAEREALLVAIHRALDYEAPLPAIATVPRRILTDALSAIAITEAAQ